MLALTTATGAQAADPWTVCVAEDNPPLSAATGRPGSPGARIEGLDVRIAEAAAMAMGRPLRLVPFDTDYEKETRLADEVNALLSSGVCDAISGFPLLHGDVGTPARESARTAGYPGAPRKPKRPFVALKTTMASSPYIGTALGLVSRVSGPEASAPATLAALAGAGQPSAATDRLGVTIGTLSGAYAMMWRHGVLKPRLVEVAQNREVLDQLVQPDAPFAHALVPLNRYDGWRLAHADAPLAVSPWRKPLGLNLGFLMLADQAGPKAALDRTIDEAIADGRMARWAGETGVTWSPPTQPAIAGMPGLAALAAD